MSYHYIGHCEILWIVVIHGIRGFQIESLKLKASGHPGRKLQSYITLVSEIFARLPILGSGTKGGYFEWSDHSTTQVESHSGCSKQVQVLIEEKSQSEVDWLDT